MTRLDRYIGRSVLAATLLAWVVVSVLDALFVLLGQLGDIGRGDYGFGDVLVYVVLGLPTRAWQAFPTAALIGVLLGLGNLAEQRELDAFRLAGCSPRRLVAAVMQTGVLLLLLVLAVGEGLAPQARHLAEQQRAQAIHAGEGVQREAGFWVHEGRRFVQVARSETDGRLAGVVIYELAPDAARLAGVTAVQTAEPHAGGWRLEGLGETRLQPDRVTVERRDHAERPALIEPRLAQLLTRDPDTLALPALGEYIDYLRVNGGRVGTWRLNYWQRLAAPLGALAMWLLAAVLVLGALGRRPLGQRLLIAVLAGLGFKLVGGVVAHAGLVYGASPAVAAFLPAVTVLLISALLLGRAGG